MTKVMGTGVCQKFLATPQGTGAMIGLQAQKAHSVEDENKQVYLPCCSKGEVESLECRARKQMRQEAKPC